MIHSFVAGELSVDVSSVGARIQQIRDRSGRAWLVETNGPEPDFADAVVDFTRGTRGGWDDCLPSIDPEPDPSAPRTIADHGDFWHREWRVERRTLNEIELSTAGIDHPLLLRKVITITGCRLEIETTAVNASSEQYSMLVSAHPLFAWPADATVQIPGATESRLAFGDTLDTRQDGTIVIEQRAAPWTGKTFVRWAGRARMRFAGSRDVLEIEQSTDTAPWIGICVNRHSWPAPHPGPDWIALEPTTSPTDSLRAAIDDSTATTLEPGDALAWMTSVTIRREA